MATSKKRKRLLDAYRFADFRPLDRVRGVFGDPKARIITLVRRSKKHTAVHVAARTLAGTTARYDGFATCRAETPACTSNWRFGGLPVEAAVK